MQLPVTSSNTLTVKYVPADDMLATAVVFGAEEVMAVVCLLNVQ